MVSALERNGYDYIIMEEGLTRFGAVETIEEGRLYYEFLKEHKGEFDGVVLSLPSFGDENGAVAALKDANVPVLVQAYPDEKGKMDFAHRRDSLCGKIAMCNVLRQCGIKYSLTKSATVHPDSCEFDEDLNSFAAVCRVVKKLSSFNVGAIGARTTAFKTVRIDEIAMQNKGVNVESIDLTMVFDLMDKAITREEFAAVLMKVYAAKYKKFDISITSQKVFADMDAIELENRNYVIGAYDNGYIEGDGNGNFNPDSNITRAEATQVLYRVIQ